MNSVILSKNKLELAENRDHTRFELFSDNQLGEGLLLENVTENLVDTVSLPLK